MSVVTKILKAEIITIGDEILIGQIVDTNSAWMGRKLNEIGWEISSIQSIRDLREHIISALELACKRSDAVLITGGLGPTKDDITKYALCDFFGSELVFHELTYAHISTVFKSINKPLLDAHRSQAMLPSNCEALPNRFGTAPGMLFHYNGCVVISMPGVPYEMKGIMEESVLPLLQSKSNEAIQSSTIVTANVPESVISSMLSDFEDGLPNHIKLAYLPHYNFVRLRLTARGSKLNDFETELNVLTNQMCEVLGKMVIAKSDLRIEEIVGQILNTQGKTVSFAESCTGGFVAHLITSVPGSSKYFPGSVVTYSYENKTDVLGVDPEILWKEGAVSESVVRKMCASVRENNNTNYGLALSGIAGPDGGTPEKPVGTLWIAVCDEHRIFTKNYQLKGNRQQNIERSANLGLEMLRKLMLGELSEGQ